MVIELHWVSLCVYERMGSCWGEKWNKISVNPIGSAKHGNKNRRVIKSPNKPINTR